MGAAKYTRGPWEVEWSRDGATVRTSGGEPIWYIADVARCLPGGSEETRANARLISAAPTVTAALIGAEAVIDRLLNHALLRLTGDVEASLVAARDEARAAIQSATGEAR